MWARYWHRRGLPLSGAVVPCERLRDALFDYLSQDVDPFDFSWMLQTWADATGEALPGEYVEELSEEARGRFTAWLKDGNIDYREDPVFLPPYTTLHAKEKLSEGTWLIHFTRGYPFRSFDRGTTIEQMQLTKGKGRADTARCPSNLTERGLGDAVFGFAVEAEGLRQGHLSTLSRKYGRNAVLFRSDCAISAWHDGDEERQAIFPLCSEYDVVPLPSVADGIEVETEDGEVLAFKSLDALIEHLDTEGTEHLAGLAPRPRVRRMKGRT